MSVRLEHCSTSIVRTDECDSIKYYVEFIGYHLQPLISVLTPIYWSTAVEVGEAVNGYTLTQGNFQREVQIEFATGK
jgi:G2F domain